MNTIQAEWDLFREKALNEEIPIQILNEMKYTFYAGASSTMALNFEIAEKYSMEASGKMIDMMMQECEAVMNHQNLCRKLTIIEKRK
jgi:hypothetical protein